VAVAWQAHLLGALLGVVAARRLSRQMDGCA
jgi:membrane associated rhomboid family serine protease